MVRVSHRDPLGPSTGAQRSKMHLNNRIGERYELTRIVHVKSSSKNVMEMSQLLQNLRDQEIVQGTGGSVLQSETYMGN